MQAALDQKLHRLFIVPRAAVSRSIDVPLPSPFLLCLPVEKAQLLVRWMEVQLASCWNFVLHGTLNFTHPIF